MFGHRYSTNWTLDGTPIEQGFDIVSDAEEDDESGIQPPSFAKAASKRTAEEDEKPEWVYTSSNPVEYQASVSSDGIEYRLSVLSDGERWHWVVADEAENIVAEGTSPEKPEAQRSAQTAAAELAGRMVGEPVRSKRAAWGPGPEKALTEDKRYPGRPIEFPTKEEDRYVGRGGEWYDGYTDAMRGENPRTFGTEEYFDGYGYGQQIRATAGIASEKPTGWYVVAPDIEGYNDIDGPFDTEGEAKDVANEMEAGDEVVYHEQSARPTDPYKAQKHGFWMEEDGDLFHMPSSEHPNVATVNGQTYDWEVLNPKGEVVASGSAASVEEAKQQAEQTAKNSKRQRVIGLMKAKERIGNLNDDRLLADGLRIAEEMERVGAEEREALQRIHSLISDEILRRGLEGT